MLGTGPVIGVWATVSVRRDGALVQVDRGAARSLGPARGGRAGLERTLRRAGQGFPVHVPGDSTGAARPPGERPWPYQAAGPAIDGQNRRRSPWNTSSR
jgi:hypothetical protein